MCVHRPHRRCQGLCRLGNGDNPRALWKLELGELCDTATEPVAGLVLALGGAGDSAGGGQAGVRTAERGDGSGVLLVTQCLFGGFLGP